MSGSTLAQVLDGQGPLLVDFDGPVCSIFAIYRAEIIASELRHLLVELGAAVPSAIERETDPLEVLRWTATLLKPTLTRAAEDALCLAELRAAVTAAPTPYAREVLSAAHKEGRKVAIVSNNSAAAINAYFDAHHLSGFVTTVVGREPYNPSKMKPDPWPILTALCALDSKPDCSVLIGDSLTDIAAARRAGVAVVGYANKPHKLEPFIQSGADAVVTSMADIAAVLESGGRQCPSR